MVIRALVQARLLGLKLLTLDACVVVGGNNPGAATPYPLSTTGLDVNDRSAMPRVMSPGSETSLAYAMRLLEQGIHTFEDSRRLHLSGAGLAGPGAGRSELCQGSWTVPRVAGHAAVIAAWKLGDHLRGVR
jgi:hypothetical protein